MHRAPFLPIHREINIFQLGREAEPYPFPYALCPTLCSLWPCSSITAPRVAGGSTYVIEKVEAQGPLAVQEKSRQWEIRLEEVPMRLLQLHFWPLV